MSRAPVSISSTAPAPGAVRRLVHQLRTEGGTPARDAAAVGLGVFVGCLPLYGVHLALCIALGWLLGLNRLKMYLAANISNPLMAPFLILAEIQAGAWIRRGEPHALSLQTVRATDPWTFGVDLVVGSVVVGAALGLGLGLATWAGARTRDRDPLFGALVTRAADRYLSTSITAWEFARGKLRGDPLYRAAATRGLLRSGGTLVDVGCGQGLMLALLAEVRAVSHAGGWTLAAAAPVFDELIGIETRPRIARLAQQALGPDATIVSGDARMHAPRACRALLFFDVLHMMPEEDQEALLRAMTAALEPGGVILVREADAGAGRRFLAVAAGNRLKALLFGNWRQTFHFRTAAGWRRCFEQMGFQVEALGADQGTPFGNLLFVLTRPRRASA
jgi:uncharacterized protein (DUF2062 family)/SAM-dependent methyltransferase